MSIDIRKLSKVEAKTDIADQIEILRGSPDAYTSS
jgi:hypothetical protein